MTAINRILCPIDFSEYSRHALDQAMLIARQYYATVTTLYVVPELANLAPMIDSPLYPPVAFTAEDLDQYRQELQDFVGRPPGDTFVEFAAVQGYPANEIVWAAEKMPADLIVMGTHGRRGFDRLMLGSVTERVLRRAPCPVLTVPCAVATPHPIFQRVLCAVDFSPAAFKALDYAVSLTARTEGSLSVVHVFEPVPVLEPAVAGGLTDAFELEARAQHAAEQRLRHVAAAVPYGVDQVVTAVGKPYQEILRVAAEQRADLIVIGVHGGPSGMLAFGSTTNQIVRRAECPVLSLKA